MIFISKMETYDLDFLADSVAEWSAFFSNLEKQGLGNLTIDFSEVKYIKDIYTLSVRFVGTPEEINKLKTLENE